MAIFQTERILTLFFIKFIFFYYYHHFHLHLHPSFVWPVFLLSEIHYNVLFFFFQIPLLKLKFKQIISYYINILLVISKV